ncbi:Adenosine/AMP deaminase domain-containing protein [Besnoitia besnoiti]|uniref:Adenosine/AMP deaminase domain-containing protein n=1 Tax=Besnoitia besnoiti TaxID=94643 RepID=A0A2A9MN17_BESBE|nr:Adenosine/AMP deaminase domain-containing protein [Besnoitia besnoiti]PFH36992.1 Adenosine/AMP deaminase domain-containing protein [Besnoitia besnoiti]
MAGGISQPPGEFQWRADCCCCCGHGVPADVLLEYARGIPKVELHVHVEGTLQLGMAVKIGEKNGVPVEGTGAVSEEDSGASGTAFGDLDSFLAEYVKREKVLRNREDFFDLVLSYLEASAALNVKHVELFFDLQSHIKRMAQKEVLQGIYDACCEAEKRWGVTSKRIMCFVRNLPVEDHIRCLEEVQPYLSMIDGVGLASSEKGNENYKFEAAFDLAKKKGLPCVAHAGEEGPAKNVVDALRLNHATRIDHGTASVQDAGLLKYLLANQVPLTACPLSNVCLGVCRGTEEHPLLRCSPQCGVANKDTATKLQAQRDHLRRAQLEKLKAAAEKDPKSLAVAPKPVVLASSTESESLLGGLAEFDNLLPLGTRRETGSRIGIQFEGLIDQGLQVTINSDDPAYFGGDICENFRSIIETNRLGHQSGTAGGAANGALLRESLHWRLGTIKTVVLNSVYAAFLPLDKKRHLAQEVENFDAEFRKKHNISNEVWSIPPTI